MTNFRRFTIFCNICEEVTGLKKIGDDYKCLTCGTMYEEEDGVLDTVIAEDMYKLFKGARLAGLIKDKELQEEYNHD